MIDGEKFESKILGVSFKDSRLRELREKAVKKGLKGDEIFEFIYLDRRDLTDEINKLKQEKRILIKRLENYNDPAVRNALDLVRGIQEYENAKHE